MKLDIHKYLDDLESRIDMDQERKLLNDYYLFSDRKMTDRSYFKPEREPAPSKIVWTPILFNETFDDYDKMIYKQLIRVNDQLSKGGGELLSFRSNFGTGLIPSMLGCEIRRMPDAQDSLPGPIHLSWEQVLSLNENYKNGQKPDVHSGLGQMTIDAAHHLEELLKDYPKLQKNLHIYQPDTQGPCSLTEAVVGSDFYMKLIEEEDVIVDCIEVITDTFIRYMQLWKHEFPVCDASYAWDYGLLYRGGVMIREDATTNISADMYEEFFQAADQKILNTFGGGAIHFCGHGDHLMESFADLHGLTAVNMSQPDMNKMDEVVYPNTIDKDIQIIGMPKYEIRRCNRHHIDLKGMVHVGVCVAAWMGEPEIDPRGENC